MRVPSATTLPAVLLAAALVACGSGSTQTAPEELRAQSSTPTAADGADFSGRGAAKGAVPGIAFASTREVQNAAPPPSPTFPPPQSSTAPAMIIRNGDVSVQVDSLELAIDAVRRIAAALGGHIGNVSIAGGEHQVRSATLEVKIPAARFDDAMSGIAPIGKVEHSSATAQDVGEEFVDVTARIANARRLEERLVTLLATRTGKLEDVLAVERELARVRGEIERYEGRIRFLASRIATSTLMVTVHERAPLVATQPGHNVIQRAFVNMWRNFVLLVANGIEALGVVLPVAALAWGLYAALRRRYRAMRLPGAPAGPTAAAS